MHKLICLSGMNKGGEFVLAEGENSIGRSEKNNICVFDKKVSRTHCRLHVSEQSAVLEDFGSTNGSRINNVFVNGKQEIRAGDHLRVGQTVFLLSNSPLLGTAEDAEPVQNEDKEYGIYRNIGNKWTLVKTLYAPPGAVFYSGQSVSHKGKTYLSTAVLYSSSGNGVMYLCSMEDGRLIQVSKNDSTKRSMDLEVISTGEKLFAYYYDYLTGKLYLSVLQ